VKINTEMNTEQGETLKEIVKQYYGAGSQVDQNTIDECIKNVEAKGFLDECRKVVKEQEKKRIHIGKLCINKVACVVVALSAILIGFGFAVRLKQMNDLRSENSIDRSQEGKDTYIRVDKPDAAVFPDFYWSHGYISTNPYPACQLTITGETAYVTSLINGEADDMITGMTVYLEKYIDDSWHTYASWVHYGGRNQENTDSIHVEHGLYRVRMTVKISLPDGYADLFDMTGNVMLFWW